MVTDIVGVFSHEFASPSSVYSGYVEWVERGGPLQQWVTFESVAERVASGRGLVVDVRGRDEIVKDGKIPTAKIVPREPLCSFYSTQLNVSLQIFLNN